MASAINTPASATAGLTRGLDAPDAVLTTAQREIAALDPKIPVALLPVRLETRFFTVSGKTELRVRVYPDDLHTAGGKPGTVLPKRWLVLAIRGGAIIARAVGGTIRDDLSTVDPDGGAVDFGASEQTSWLVDFDAAKVAGMGVVLEITGRAVTEGIDHLVVLGVRSGDGAATLSTLLDAAGDVRIPAPGTPTNSTEGALAGVTDEAPPFKGRAGEPAVVDGFNLRDSDALALAFGVPSSGFRSLPGASREEQAKCRAMNAALWPVTLAPALEDLLRAAGDRGYRASVDALGDWFASYVRAGGPLPALQVGRQPYGVLPVTPIVSSSSPSAPLDARICNTLLALWPTWAAAAARVPRLDVDATDLASDGAVPESPLAAILAMQPAPVRYMARPGDEGASALLTGFQGGTNPRPPISGELATWSAAAQAAYKLVTSTAASLSEQQSALKTLLRTLPLGSRWRTTFADRQVHLDAYAALFAPLINAGLPEASVPPLLPSSGQGLVGTLRAYDETPMSWSSTTVVRSGDGAVLTAIAAAIDKSIATRSSPTNTAAPSGASLLHHLICPLPARAHSTDVANALRTLSTQSTADLERWLAGTLDLAGTRLDAWATSVATSRLAARRKVSRSGLTLGGYGYVRDLKPRADGTAPGQGFIHTPSLDHAVTAAVLRSGHSAYDDASAGATFAVNLDSRRARLARWLFDGVRQGQPLSVLLGQRFERALHNAAQDQLVDDVRAAVLAAKGSKEPPIEVVDGLCLARGWQEGDDLTTAELKLGAWKRSLKPDIHDALAGAMADLDDALDAAADAGLFEAVFSLVQGNSDRAGATLEAIDQGDAPPPDLRSLESPRAGITVQHRTLLVLPSPASAPGSLSGLADPRLEAMAARLLGPLGRVRYDLRWRQPDGALDATVDRLNLASLGVDALELLRCANADSLGGSELEARLLARAPIRQGALPELDETAGTGIQSTEITLAELRVVASALRAALLGGRALEAEDLASTAASEYGLSELLARAGTITKVVKQVLDTLPAEDADPTDTQLRDARLACDKLGLAPTLTPADGEQRAAIAALRSSLLTTLAVVADGVRVGTSAALTSALQSITGWALPISAPALLSATPTLQDPAVTPSAVAAWLAGVARVRPATASFERALRLSEAVAGEPLLTLEALQTWSEVQTRQALPEAPTGWVATTAPAAGRTYTSFVLAATAKQTIAAGAAVCGLILDSWSERIPAGDQLTGLAIHWDAPSSRAPQAILLAVPEPDKTWSASALALAITQTMELARMRLVGPEHLAPPTAGSVGAGQHLPAIQLPGVVYPGGLPLAEIEQFVLAATQI